MDMGTIVKPMIYGFVAVDDFSKVVSFLQLKHKQVNEIMRALEEVFKSLGLTFSDIFR